MKFIVNSNLFVSLCATSLAWTTYKLYDIPVNVFILLIVFISTLFVYNFHRYVKNRKVIKQTGKRPKRINKHFSILSFLFICILWFFLEVRAMIFFSVIGLLTIIYSVGFLRIRGELTNLRKVPYVKLIWISLMWTLITVSFPLLDQDFQGNYWLLFAERFVFVAGLTIPFDIRDMEADLHEGIKTIPLKIGGKRARNIALLCMAAFALISACGSYIEMHHWYESAALIVSALFTSYLIYIVDEARPGQFFTIGMEGMSLLQALLLFLFTQIHLI